MQYRPEIDGLRAVAVLFVILFHAGFEMFDGGFVGVDIFFVISGYLITSIITGEMSQDKFSIIKFYERRVRRILPALYFVMACCIPLAWLILLPHQIKDFSQSLLATAALSSNFFFYLETDYFNEFTNNAPLLHTWSLAIEEQFYLVFPLFLLITAKWGLRFQFALVAAILCISLALSNIAVNQNSSLAFYFPHTRAWELMIGSLLALFHFQNSVMPGFINSHQPNYTCEFFSALGFLLIIFSVLTYNSSIPTPSLYTLIPTVGTALIIAFSSNQTVIGKILSFKIFVLVGLISYSAYLIHVPVFSFLTLVRGDVLSKENSIICVLFIFCLAYFMWRFVEQPFRKKNKFSSQLVFGSALSCAMIFIGMGLIGHMNHGFQNYFASKYANDGGIILINRDLELALRGKFRLTAYADNDSSFSKFSALKLLIIGDSMADDAFMSLQMIADNQEQVEVRRLKVGRNCMDNFADFLSNQLSKMEIKCEGETIKIPANILKDASHILVTTMWLEHTYLSGYLLAKILKSKFNGKVFVSSSPMFQDVTSLSLGMAKSKINLSDSGYYMFKNIRWDRKTTSDKLKSLVEANEAIYFLDKESFFCSLNQEECQIFDSNGRSFIYDSGHLTIRGMERYGPYLIEKLSPNFFFKY